MAGYEERRSAKFFHTIVAILLLLTGGGLIGFGIWLTVAENTGPFNLDYTGDGDVFDVVLRTNVIVLIAGSFIMLSGISSMLSLAKKCIGQTFRIIYIVLAIILFLIFGALCVISAIIMARRNDDNVEEFIRDAWERTVKKEESVVCHIENTFECRGFYDDDCKPLSPVFDERCGTCNNETYDVDTAGGCYFEITHLMRTVFLPVAIVSGAMAIVIFIDMMIACCFW